MREIKFRAIDRHSGKWVHGLPASDTETVDYSEIPSLFVGATENEDCYLSEIIPGTLCQYTGLKDKNGKEIYDGDIVAFEDSDGGYEYPDVVVNTGIVEYGELRFYFTNRVAAEMDDFYIKDGRCDDVEVVGNIYENPEILEVE